WTKVDELPAWGYTAFAFSEGHAFAANPQQIFRSVDGGTGWTPVGDFGVRDLLVVDDVLYAATTKGIQVSTDHGSSWTAGPTSASTAKAGLVLASDGTHVFAAGDGLARSEGPRDPWSRLHVGADSIHALASGKASVLAFSGQDVFHAQGLV